jgi:hypothetical protein
MLKSRTVVYSLENMVGEAAYAEGDDDDDVATASAAIARSQ